MYLLSTYCVLGTRLGFQDVERNKTESLLALFYWGKPIKHTHTGKFLDEVL